MNNSPSISERPSVEPKWLMPLVDFLLVILAFILAYFFRYNLQLIRPVLDPNQAGFIPYIPFMLIYALLLFLRYQGGNLYRNIRGRSWAEEVSIISSGVMTATVILLALFFAFRPTVTSRLMLIYVAVLSIILLSLARIVHRMIQVRLRDKGIGLQNVLIAGMGDTGQAVLRTMVARSELGYKVIGYLDDNDEKGLVDIGRVKGLGKLENIASVIQKHRVDLVVITLRWKHYNRIQEMVRSSRRGNADVRLVPDIFQLNMRQVQVENLDGIPLLGVDGTHEFRGTNRVIKRVVDLGLIILSAPVWLLVFGLVGLAIRLEGPGPIFYQQKRIGENGKPFMMYKFRSMIPNADEMKAQMVEEADVDPRHPKFPDDPRITKVGQFLRRTSLDEFPNILNVIQGQMSLVGPRPPTPDEVALYEPWHHQRLNFIPGMTGLWQVSGRSDVPFEEMCLLDIYYIENWSINLDTQILLMTVPRVLLQRGAY